jgi:hypothetical protein
VTEAKSPNLSGADMRTAFVAGKVRMLITSTAYLNTLAKQIGERSNRAAPDNFHNSNREPTEGLFYRFSGPTRFYTTKTLTGHQRVKFAVMQNTTHSTMW